MKIISVMCAGALCLFFLLLLLSSGYSEKAQTDRLSLILSIRPDRDFFFRTIPFIALDNENNIYAVDNLQHVIIKFDSKGKLVSRIGRHGQGPGDLELPWLIKIRGKVIFVADNTSISIFDLEGHFQNRFKRFHPLISMAVCDDKVFLAEPADDRIINVYNYNGRKLFSFGHKYSVDYAIYKGWPNKAIDRWLNDGKLLCAGSRIYFITSLFGDIFAYDLRGNLISTKRIEDNEFIEKNRVLYFKKGMINKGNGAFTHNKFLEDAFYYQGKIFVLLSAAAGKWCEKDIWQLDEKTFQIERSYSIFERDQRDKIWCRSMVVTSDHHGSYLFYVALYDSVDFVINVYK